MSSNIFDSFANSFSIDIKTEPVFESNAIKNDPLHFYCRICFKIFESSDGRNELDSGIMAMIRELLQTGMKFSSGSNLVCESCNSTLNNFYNFKHSVMEKQAKFSQLVVRNAHHDYTAIQELNEFEEVELESEIYVKQEPMYNFATEIFTSPIEISTQGPSRRTTRVRKNKKKIEPTTVTTCDECGVKVLNILNHKIKKHGVKHLFECSSCSYSSYEKRKLQYHMQNVHAKKLRNINRSRVCPHCAKQVRHLDEHIANIHCGERNFFCDLCSFSSYRKKPIELHMMNLHLPKSVKCSLCEFTTISDERLKKHMKNQHAVQEHAKEYICSVPECQKAFRNKFNLLCHVKRCHEGEVKFNCDAPDCGKSFFTKSEQRIHFQNSHCPKNIICDECGNSFSSTAMLRKHSSLHREYRYPCTFQNCGLKYRNATQLKNHMNRVHLDRKEHECDQCTAAFYTARDLDRHIVSKHLGIKFVCEVPGCGSTLSRRDAYMSHIKSHAGLTEDDRKDLLKKLNEFCIKMNLKR